MSRKQKGTQACARHRRLPKCGNETEDAREILELGEMVWVGKMLNDAILIAVD